MSSKQTSLFDTNILNNRLSPIIKWAGGKEQELKYIFPLLPQKFNNYYEPFIGGGAVYFSISSNHYFINDKLDELIYLYKMIKNQDIDFFNIINNITINWENITKFILTNSTFLINLYKKISNNSIEVNELKNNITLFISQNILIFKFIISEYFDYDLNMFVKELEKNINNKILRMKKIELEKGKLIDNDIIDNIESSIKSAYYMYLRYLYNNIKKFNISKSKEISLFFFIRNFAYSGMFRYNNQGNFNVPYGGIGYNRKNLFSKIEYFKSKNLLSHLYNTTIENLDFEEFLIQNNPTKNDFIFLDPPYDSEFSTYAKNIFDKNDQIRLANYLINNCQAKWMMIIKNTDFIYNLYNKKDIFINSFDKKYLVSFKNRNEKDVTHLIIRNYK